MNHSQFLFTRMDSDKLVRYLKGDTNQTESEEVYQWISESIENEREFKTLRRLHDFILWHEEKATEKPVKKTVQKRHVHIIARIAAVFFIGVGLFYFYLHTTGRDFSSFVNGKNLEMMETVVPTGQYIELVLDDGTKVWLNSKSTLTHPTRFKGSKRVVHLSGEGYFDVSHDPRHPFIVETSGYKIEVLGTEFNIRAYEGLYPFEASLLEGSIMVESTDMVERLYLKPNERAVGEKDELKKTSFKEDELRWREGILFIDDKSIHEILPILEQYYGVKFVIENENLKKDKKFTGKFLIRDGIEHILNVFMLQDYFNFEINTSKNLIIIK